MIAHQHSKRPGSGEKKKRRNKQERRLAVSQRGGTQKGERAADDAISPAAAQTTACGPRPGARKAPRLLPPAGIPPVAPPGPPRAPPAAPRARASTGPCQRRPPKATRRLPTAAPPPPQPAAGRLPRAGCCGGTGGHAEAHGAAMRHPPARALPLTCAAAVVGSAAVPAGFRRPTRRKDPPSQPPNNGPHDEGLFGRYGGVGMGGGAAAGAGRHCGVPAAPRGRLVARKHGGIRRALFGLDSRLGGMSGGKDNEK